MDLDAARTLLLALEHQSFAGAAAKLRVPVSTVSRRVRELERELGRDLLVRSSRGIRSAPEAGEIIERLRRMLDAVEAVHESAGGARAALRRLRLSVPLELSLELVPLAIVDLRLRHPTLACEVVGESRRAALTEESVDLAVRLGQLEDSSFLRAALGSLALWLVAPPDVVVRGPTSLSELPLVEVMGAPPPIGRWGKREVSIGREPVLRVSSFAAAVTMVQAGAGAAVVPAYAALGPARAGRLKRVEELVLPAIAAHALYPRRHRGQLVIDDLITSLRARLAVGRDRRAG